MSIQHVIPINDLKEHLLSSDCDCKPTYSEKVFIHNAWDNREIIEVVNDILK